MKTLFRSLVVAGLLLASGAAAHAASVSYNSVTKEITNDLKIGSGRALTVKSGGTFTVESGGTLVIAGEVTLPAGTAPVTNAAGEIAFDTDAWGSGRGAEQVYDGTASTYLLGALVSDVPTNGQVPKWNTGGTITWEDDSTGGGGGIGGSTGGVDNAVIRANGAGGATLQATGVIIDDSDNISGLASLAIDAAGVVLDTNGDGMLIVLGAGDGTDEDIRINLDAANVATFTSTTGVVTANFSSIALQESGNAVPNASDTLAFFAPTTSLQLLTLLSDETGTGAAVFANTPTLVTPVLGAATGTSLALGADPGDAGVLRLENAAVIAWEAAPAGTDVTLTVDSSEVMQSSGTFNATALTEGGTGVPNVGDNLSVFAATTSAQLSTLLSNETGTGVTVFNTAPTFVTSITTPVLISGAADPADAGVIRLGNTEGLAWELATPGTDYTLVLNSSNVLTASGTFNATALTEGGTGVPNVGDNLSVFAATTSAQLLTLLSDETGTGLAVGATAPTFTTSIQIGAAGVLISDDGDGALTFLGLGNGNDENLVLNFDDSANTIAISSTTGVTAIDPGSIGLDLDSATVTLSTVAGVVDAGGATSLELPNGAAPSVSVFGQIAGDNNLWAAGRGAVVFHDGTAPVALLGALVSDVPADGQVPKWNTGGTITWENASGTGDVSAATTFGTDNLLIKSDGTSRGVQATGIVVDDSNNLSGVGDFTAANVVVGAISGLTSLTIDTDGVVLDTSNGKIDLTGAGNGTDENLRIDLNASNVATFTSSTGVVTANFSSIALQESGNAVPNATDTLAFFGSTTSVALDGVISDDTGSGALVFATSPTLVTPDLGTPSAIVLTSGTGLPISTGVTGLGTGVATWLGTPSSANLATAVTGETGSGALVFGTSPTFTTSALIGAAGVAFSDGDGALTITGNGSGTDENLTFNLNASNVVTLSSSSAVATMDFGAIGIDLDSASVTLSTVAGIVDAGGATSMEIPNGAAPTVDVFGEIAGDSNLWAASRGTVLIYDGTAVTAAVNVLVSDVPTNLQVPKFNTATGTITWENDDNSGSTTAINDLADASADGAVAQGAFEMDFTSTLDSAAKAAWTITNTDADLAASTGLIDLKFNDSGDAEAVYLRLISDAAGTPDNDFLFSQASFTSALPIILSGTTPLDFGAAGVRVTGDGDGAITFLGLGDGADEDFVLNLDDTANTLVASSSTGLNTIDLNFATATLHLGTAGVSISGSADGAITFTGRGNGTDEAVSLDLDNTTNIGTWSTSTGVTAFDYGAIGADFDSATVTLSVVAGVIDAGAATSFELPNANNPTTDAEGEIAWDANNDFLEVFGAAASRVIPTLFTAGATFADPDGLQVIADAWPVMRVEDEWAPFGITIVDIFVATSASSTYSVNLEEWTSPADGAPATIETVATSAGTEAEDDGTLADASIAAGSYVFVDLPTTAEAWVSVMFTYTINPGN